MEQMVRVRLNKSTIDKLDKDSGKYGMSRASYLEFLIKFSEVRVLTQSVPHEQVEAEEKTQVVTDKMSTIEELRKKTEGIMKTQYKTPAVLTYKMREDRLERAKIKFMEQYDIEDASSLSPKQREYIKAHVEELQ